MVAKLKYIISTLCLVLVTAFAVPSLASASPVNVLPSCGASNDSICSNGGGSGNAVFGVIKGIINLLITIAGIVSVIMIIVGGIKYSTSGGDAKAISSGKDTLVYAVIGLVISILSFAIVNFVLGKI